jgi:uncharacterized protein
MQSGLICATCGTRTAGRKATKGSTLIELILWCCFIIPGLIYSVWRLTTRARACHACGATALVPLNTPVGQKLASAHLVPLQSADVRQNGDGTANGNQDAWVSRGELLGRLFHRLEMRGTIATLFLIASVIFGVYSISGRSFQPISAATTCVPGNTVSCQPRNHLPPTVPVDAQTTSATIRPRPSFDCAKAKSTAELLICADPELSKMDDALSETYKAAKAAAMDRVAFNQENNREWEWRERNCSDRACLIGWYTHRKAQLSAVIASAEVPETSLPAPTPTRGTNSEDNSPLIADAARIKRMQLHGMELIAQGGGQLLESPAWIDERTTLANLTDVQLALGSENHPCQTINLLAMNVSGSELTVLCDHKKHAYDIRNVNGQPKIVDISGLQASN